ncbi:MAG: hypothetical protein COT81_03820 [Candidatus Buchananbacteria bacterium CG10_big_fil_rev_8_21_14_0_10_42_9]|uniref:Uncharacterized protein n=1 Tax=Candidatus Buchananbacteria bacterium CG10_big_fil_rev_8_21_14_0_10_42_9 TaxID=1974526 RepID=A0A2H0W0M8_9BACT|nr:MAG: hypothetical protein COT81_03820 [Candidatus Buchananbacteria bacterium CG10_big_fil_rev_8_21_14_0_10_42_9]
MKKALVIASLSVLALPAFVFAQVPEKTDGFVCPVITAEAVGEHNPQAGALGDGNYTIPPHGGAAHVPIPLHATNGDGAGSPGDSSAPGDTDYTAIWAR